MAAPPGCWGTSMKIEFRTINLDQLAKDGHDSVFVPLSGMTKSYSLEFTRDGSGGLCWAGTAAGSKGVRVPILKFSPEGPEVVFPFIFAEACKACLLLPVDAKNGVLTVLHGRSVTDETTPRLGVYVACP